MVCKASFFVKWLEETETGLTRDKTEFWLCKDRTRVGCYCIIQEEIKGEVWIEQASKTENKILLAWIKELKRHKQNCCRALKILQKGDFWETFSAWVAVGCIIRGIFHIQILVVCIILHFIFRIGGFHCTILPKLLVKLAVYLVGLVWRKEKVKDKGNWVGHIGWIRADGKEDRGNKI